MKATNYLATAVAIGLTMMGSALCHAQDADKRKAQFERLDADKNGSISLEEFKAKSKTPETADKKFARLDTDKNGSLSLEEWTTPPKKAPTPKEPATE
jgi:Ca2+-binding EF-hand superfamily protein